jgi:hypothetical protein
MSPEETPKIFDEPKSPRTVSAGSLPLRLDERRGSTASPITGDDYLRRRSSIVALTDSPHARPMLSPRSASDQSGRKRKESDRDDSAIPISPLSISSSLSQSQEQIVTTPHLEVPEPPLKRRASSPRLVADKDMPQKASSSSPPASTLRSLFGWDRPESAVAFTEYKFSEAANKASSISIGPQEPVIAFPIQFPWQPPAQTSPTSTAATAPAQQGIADRSGIAIDPALSSVRSSAGQATTGETSPAVAPEIRFPEETLASATDSPGDATVGDVSQLAAVAAQAAEASNASNASLGPPIDDRKPNKDQPFSRSPELRVSHKLAERKRRKEMKDLFDELRELLPAERGSKSSKWEILSKCNLPSFIMGHG